MVDSGQQQLKINKHLTINIIILKTFPSVAVFLYKKNFHLVWHIFFNNNFLHRHSKVQDFNFFFFLHYYTPQFKDNGGNAGYTIMSYKS